MNRNVQLTDEQIRDALIPELRHGLVALAAEDIAGAIRAAPRATWWTRWATPIGPGQILVRAGWLVALSALLLVGLLVIAGGASQRTRPALGGNGLVAVGSNAAGIVLVDPTTSDARRLVPPWEASASGRTDRSDLLAFSPDGSRLAYIAAPATGWSIEIVDVASGASVGRLTEQGDGLFPEWGLQWSRDGSQLILAATVGGLPTVVGVDIEASETYPIANAASQAYDPTVSPVDDQVAFVRSDSTFTDDYRLVVTDLRGQGEIDVLAGLNDGTEVAGAPRWSPDGEHLVVTLAGPDGRHALATVGLGGGEPTVITPWQDGWIAGSWSPDGSRILVALSPQGGREADIYTNGDQRAELEVVNPDGTNRRTLSSRACANAAWAPDAQAIVFEAYGCEDDTDAVEVHRVELAGGDDRVLWTGIPRLTGRPSIGWQALPTAP